MRNAVFPRALSDSRAFDIAHAISMTAALPEASSLAPGASLVGSSTFDGIES